MKTLIEKFANRIDADKGYDNLRLAQDLAKIVEQHTGFEAEQAYKNHESTKTYPKTKDADLGLQLKADSGYTSIEQHRISSNQYSRICLILAEK